MVEEASRIIQKSVTRSGEFLKASINHAGLKLDISTKDANKSLSEIRKILECLQQEQTSPLEDFTVFELGTMLSEEFMKNEVAVKQIHKLLSMEQEYRVVKEIISAIEEIDFIKGEKHIRIDTQSIKKSIHSLIQQIDVQTTKHALIHIKGLVPAEERLIIIDHVHKYIPHAKIKAYHTEQDIEGKVLIEGIFFGDYLCCEE